MTVSLGGVQCQEETALLEPHLSISPEACHGGDGGHGHSHGYSHGHSHGHGPATVAMGRGRKRKWMIMITVMGKRRKMKRTSMGGTWTRDGHADGKVKDKDTVMITVMDMRMVTTRTQPWRKS